MDDENQRITEIEQRLLGIIKAQADLIQSFMDSAKRRLDKHKERLDTHRQDLDELEVKVDELDADKQDYPDEYEERSRIAQEESDKLEAEQLAEEKELQARMAISDILDRIERLEEGVTDADTDADEGILEQLKLVQGKVAALEKFIHGRLKSRVLRPTRRNVGPWVRNGNSPGIAPGAALYDPKPQHTLNTKGAGLSALALTEGIMPGLTPSASGCPVRKGIRRTRRRSRSGSGSWVGRRSAASGWCRT